MDKLKEAAALAAQQLKDKVAEKMAKTPLEKALHEATADVNWNASNKVLQEVAEHTYSFGDFTEVMKHIWKRVSADKKQWRRTLKCLTLIEYLIKNGSPRCVQEFKDEIYQIRSLKDFAHYDEGQDRGAAIREKSKIIVDLLNDDQKIDEERKKAQEMKDRIGDMSGYGSKSNKYAGSGSGSSYSSSSRFDSYSSKDKGKLTGYGSSDSQNWRNDRGGGYDDTRKAGSWRVEKNDEPSYKNKDREPETDNGDYVVKSGTKYDISMINKQESDDKPVEKPKATVKPGTKSLAPPKGSTAPPVVQQQEVVNFLDMDAPATTTQPATTQNADPFNWNQPQSQPQQKAQTQAQPQNTWDWNQTGPGNNQQSAPSNSNNQGFNWNQPQTAQPQPAQTNPIQNLYQQQQPQNQFGFQQQGQFGFNNAPQGNAFQQQPMNNLASQMGQLNFNATPNTNMQTNTNNANQFNFGSAPVSNSPAKDGFDDFQSAKPVPPAGSEYKNYSQNEKSIIDLSDLSSEMNKKKDIKEKINASKVTNDGFLYSSKEELDNFFIPPQPLNNMNTNMGNMGGMGGMGGMGNMQNMQGGMNNMGGFNQQGMRNMSGMQQMGGMGQMGGLQQMGGMGQMGGMSQMGGMQQMGGQMGGMNMGYGNMGGNPNMGGFNPMMGNNQGNFGGQMGGMGYGYGGR